MKMALTELGSTGAVELVRNRARHNKHLNRLIEGVKKGVRETLTTAFPSNDLMGFAVRRPHKFGVWYRMKSSRTGGHPKARRQCRHVKFVRETSGQVEMVRDNRAALGEKDGW